MAAFPFILNTKPFGYRISKKKGGKQILFFNNNLTCFYIFEPSL